MLRQFLLLAGLTLLALVAGSQLHPEVPDVLPASVLAKATERWGGGPDSATTLVPAPALAEEVHAAPNEGELTGITAAAYLVMDGSTGQVLTQHNAE